MTSPSSSLTLWLTMWSSAETMRTLGWALIHFVWEGLAIALILYVVLGFSRSALVRYNASVCALLGMFVAPVVTFAVLAQRSEPSTPLPDAANALRTIQVITSSAGDKTVSALASSVTSVDWLGWFVLAWFCGVLVFGLRALGGWVLLARVRREHNRPLATGLIEMCHALQQRLQIGRSVRYLQSKIVHTPAVMGWFRPVVLIPASAIGGLSPEQLEAVIVHELAHIKRLDCFVNLFQIAAETLLFYHPAIWWVNRVIRTERENCCDDVAVATCGNAGEYARALTLLETARIAPSWALAATGGVLKSRVSRLLGLQSITRSVPAGGLAAIGVLCAAGVLIAATAFNENIARGGYADPPRQVEDLSAAPAPAAQAIASPAPAAPVHPGWPVARAMPAPAPVAAPAAAELGAPAVPADPEEQADSSAPSASSYIDGLRAAGLKDLTVDQLIELKVQDVTPAYVRDMRAAGFDPTVHELVAMKVQGISPEYVKDLRAAGLNPGMHDLIGMKVQGITPDYIKSMQSAGLGDVKIHDLIAMKVQGIDSEYVKDIRATGLNPSLHDLIGMRVQNVTPEYIRGLKSAGLGDLKTHDYISAKVMDITPEFIEKVRSHGFKDLSLHQLIALKNAGIF